jgi:hypothetical protein
MMPEWFSAMVRIAIAVEGIGVTNSSKSVFIFQAVDFDQAMDRALALGRGIEREYANEDGRIVRWRLVGIETIDMLGPEIVDGCEVYSEPSTIDDPKPDDFDQEYSPDQSKPTQSGV